MELIENISDFFSEDVSDIPLVGKPLKFLGNGIMGITGLAIVGTVLLTAAYLYFNGCYYVFTFFWTIPATKILMDDPSPETVQKITWVTIVIFHIIMILLGLILGQSEQKTEEEIKAEEEYDPRQGW